MKVYLAERHYDREGFTVIGIYSSKELAEKANIEDAEKGYGDRHEIEEMDIDVTYD